MRLFFLLILMCAACRSHDKRYVVPGTLTAKDSLYTIVDSTGVPSYLLHFTPVYGTTYYYTEQTEVSARQEVMDKEIETVSNETIDFHYRLSDEKNGNSKLTLTYDNFKLKGKTGNKELNIDAANTEKGAPEEIFKILKGAVFRAQISPKGIITGITGIKELQDSIYKLSDSNPENKKLLQSMVSKTISEDALKQMLLPEGCSFPIKALHIGESWKIRTEILPADFNIPVVSTYTLQDIEEGLATITLHSDIQLNDVPIQIQGYNVNATLTGTQNGEISIEMVSGTIQNWDQQLQMKGKLEILGNSVPLTLTYSSKLTRKRHS